MTGGDRKAAWPGSGQTKGKNIARVWNYWLGGSDYYPVDRTAAEDFVLLYPDIVTIAKQDRLFLARALQYLAGDADIRQFVDIGIGLPTALNTHELAQATAHDSKIVYVDNDKIVLAHARAWMANSAPGGLVTCVEADLQQPEQLVSRIQEELDPNQPAAVLLLGVLGHACVNAEEMRSTAARLMAAVPSGSYLVVSDGVRIGHQGYLSACRKHRYHLRTVEEFRDCFTDLDLVEPGVVPVNQWRPNENSLTDPLPCYVAIGKKV